METNKTQAMDVNAWMAARSTRQRVVFAALKAKVLCVMREKNVPVIWASYEGGGDSGDFTEIVRPDGEALPKDCIEIAAADYEVYNDESQETRQVPLADLAQRLAELALELLHGGWENGEGGCGNITIEAATGKVQVEHNAYYVESTNYVDEL